MRNMNKMAPSVFHDCKSRHRLSVSAADLGIICLFAFAAYPDTVLSVSAADLDTVCACSKQSRYCPSVSAAVCKGC